MSVACVLIPHFRLKAEAQRMPELRNRHVLLVRTEGSQRTIADYSPSLSGVQPGMQLRQAVTFARSARLVEADDSYYDSMFDQILDALSQRSPDVEEAGPGCAYVGMDGLQDLYGGDARLILALHRAIPDHYGAHVGAGRGKFEAYLAALSAKPGAAFRAPPDLSFLEGFPVDVLPVSFKVRAALHQFALHVLGDVAALPLGAMQSQFGPIGKRIWELASGADNDPVIPRRVEETISESLSFAEPVSALEHIVLGAEVLLGRVFQRPERRGRCARLITLQAHVWRRAAWGKRFTFKAPVGEPHQAMSRIKSGLENATIPGPLEDLVIVLESLTGETGHQSSLFQEVRKRRQLQDAIRQLDAVLGEETPIFHIRDVEPWSRIPERRHALLPVVR